MPIARSSSSIGHGNFPVVAMVMLTILCIAPIIALFSVGSLLGRDCVTENRTDGEAGASMIWRIETERCGQGPLVTNVLIAPRGKTLALAASSTGWPRPIGVHRGADGIAYLLLEGEAGKQTTAVLLPLKASGRPATSLVLTDGHPRR